MRLYGEPIKVEKRNRKNFILNETVRKWLIVIWFKCFTNRFRGETMTFKLLYINVLSVSARFKKWFESGFGSFFILVNWLCFRHTIVPRDVS